MHDFIINVEKNVKFINYGKQKVMIQKWEGQKKGGC